MLVGDVLKQTEERLFPFAAEEAALESRIMLSSLLKVELKDLRFHINEECGSYILDVVNEWIERRSKHEPLQYMLGSWRFFGRDFSVSPDALIPRQETEELCELAVKIIRENAFETVLDLCCGTGCIGITLKKETGIDLCLTDIDERALSIAAENCRKLEVEAELLKGDLFCPISGRTFDLIVSNPPYLTEDEMAALQPELAYEPKKALYGGSDGLSFYRRIADSYKRYLNRGGYLLMEIGASQAEAVRQLFPGCTVIKDIAGNDRICLVCDHGHG